MNLHNFLAENALSKHCKQMVSLSAKQQRFTLEEEKVILAQSK